MIPRGGHTIEKGRQQMQQAEKVEDTKRGETFYFDYGPKISRYLWASNYIKDKKVLDIGCSSGYGSHHLAASGAKMVVGGDSQESNIRYAKGNYSNEVLDFLLCDATNMPFHSSFFDVIVCFELIEHLRERQQRQLLSECRRCLTEGGIFLCSTPNKKFSTPHQGAQHWSHQHIKELYPDEFEQLLGEVFSEAMLFGSSPLNIMSRVWYRHLEYFIGEYVTPRIPRGLMNAIRHAMNFVLVGRRGIDDVANSKFSIQPYEDRLHWRYLIALCR